MGSTLSRLLAATTSPTKTSSPTSATYIFLNDMGDNLNANGAAPVAPYVFLSFLFEIMVEFMFLVCVLDSICSSTMLVHMISFISVIAVMIYFVLIRIKSRSNLLIYSTGGTSPTATPVSWMAWSMPPRSPSSTAMSARCRFGAHQRTSCITSRRRPTITTGPCRRTLIRLQRIYNL